MDALIKTLEKEGSSVEARGEVWRLETVAVIDGQRIPFFLRETLKMEKRELTPEQKRYALLYEGHVYGPSGALVLRTSLSLSR